MRWCLWLVSNSDIPICLSGPCTPSAYCGLTACRRQLCSICSALSSSKLTYAASSWWGFTTFVDRPRINAVLRRAARSDLWTLAGMSDVHTFEDLCNSADDEFFIKIRKYSNHILHGLLPPPSTASQNYSLRQRAHSLQLSERSTLSDCNLLMRMMYKNSY